MPLIARLFAQVPSFRCLKVEVVPAGFKYSEVLQATGGRLHLDLSIRFFKRLAWRQGLYATPRVREPLLSFDGVHERLADELIERVLAMTREVS